MGKMKMRVNMKNKAVGLLIARKYMPSNIKGKSIKYMYG
jgi:hypothetical protein